MIHFQVLGFFFLGGRGVGEDGRVGAQGEGVLPYMGYVVMCRCERYGLRYGSRYGLL